MQITNVNIPSYDNDGLKDISMSKLGNIVLISGKNGSGKTRILNKIFNRYISKPKTHHITLFTNQLAENEEALILYENTLKINQTALANAASTQQNERKDNIEKYEKLIESTKNTIRGLRNTLNWNEVETTQHSDNYLCVHFIPKVLLLEDCNNFSKNQLISFASSIDSVGMHTMQSGALAKIQYVQNQWYSATHQHSQLPENDKIEIISAYEKLKQIISVFLNTSIGRNQNDEATLFGLSLGQTNLSDGQKILLQFCLAIYSQEAALKDIILIMDEPENHLHPSIIIETIERIQKCVSNGQIWIATHSIPLLAHFDPSLIWYVEDGKIEHAGKIPEKVLQSLLGDENEIAKLQDFISLPAQYATSRYAFESLLEPRVVTTVSTDPQSFQIRTDLLKLAANGKLRILDYGAGKGRLISNITDLDDANKEKLIESMEYIAYDKFPDDKDQCESALTKAYGSSSKKYFNDINSLLSDYRKGSFDVVIMCNVLHEIDPKEWLILFGTNGTISNLLSEKGILLLVEDQQIPIGEKAYQKGFLVLDTSQLIELFKIPEGDSGFSCFDLRGDGRLKAHHIPKSYLTQIDSTSRIAAIESMSKMAKEKIIDVRTKEKNYQNGKLHGFWTQQFANAQLNLEEFR